MKHVSLLSRLALAIVVTCVQVNDVAAGKKKSKNEQKEQIEQDEKIMAAQNAADKVLKDMAQFKVLFKASDDKIDSKISDILKKDLEISEMMIQLFESVMNRIRLLEVSVPGLSSPNALLARKMGKEDEKAIASLKAVVSALSEPKTSIPETSSDQSSDS